MANGKANMWVSESKNANLKEGSLVNNSIMKTDMNHNIQTDLERVNNMPVALIIIIRKEKIDFVLIYWISPIKMLIRRITANVLAYWMVDSNLSLRYNWKSMPTIVKKALDIGQRLIIFSRSCCVIIVIKRERGIMTDTRRASIIEASTSTA